MFGINKYCLAYILKITINVCLINKDIDDIVLKQMKRDTRSTFLQTSP